MTLPILYSFRRCPYAMRARMAIAYTNTQVELREILLKNKPDAMLAVSPKGTVPVLVINEKNIIDESIEIMFWALKQNDPDNWYSLQQESIQSKINQLINENDREFKTHLDKYKYAVRFPEQSMLEYREKGEIFLAKLNFLLSQHAYLVGDQICLADIAIFPFIRQFAYVEIDWFKKCEYEYLKLWLFKMLESNLFTRVMLKYQPWKTQDNPTFLPTLDTPPDCK